MDRQDPRVTNPRYAGATLDEMAKTVFRASNRRTTKVPRKSVLLESPLGKATAEDRHG